MFQLESPFVAFHGRRDQEFSANEISRVLFYGANRVPEAMPKADGRPAILTGGWTEQLAHCLPASAPTVGILDPGERATMSQKKRAAEEYGAGLKRHTNYADGEEKGEELVFEDPFGDDLEDEEMVDSGDDESEEVVDGEAGGSKDDVDMEDDGEAAEPVKKVFMPGVDKLEDDEVLDYDASAYDMYYAMTAEWPSLSIDVIRDNHGAVRTRVRWSVVRVVG